MILARKVPIHAILSWRYLWCLVGFLLVHQRQHLLRFIILNGNGCLRLLKLLRADRPFWNLGKNWWLLQLLYFLIIHTIVQIGWLGNQIDSLLPSAFYSGWLKISIFYIIKVILALISLILLEWSNHLLIVSIMVT